MIIILAAITWFYLATYEGDHPMIGPLSKQDCQTLQRIRVQTGSPKGACIPAMPRRRDPRCDGPARYDAMREADRSGFGQGQACQ